MQWLTLVPLWGQQAPPARRPLSPRDYGVDNINILQIPAAAFVPTSSQIGYQFDPTFGYLWATSNTSGLNTVFQAPVTLPTGSLITFVDLYYDDADASNDIVATLHEYSGTTLSAGAQIAFAASTGSPGHDYAFSSPLSYTVNNDVAYGGGAQLAVVINIPLAGLGSNLEFKAVDIWWTRQISPAPAIATFGDVPTNHPFFRVIEALASAGITSGCGGNNFCPNGTVTRQEVAKFIVRALGLYWPDAPGFGPSALSGAGRTTGSERDSQRDAARR
jgi:hypothetical protein